jgi:energy-converting hydrogenase Eha subunit F
MSLCDLIKSFGSSGVFGVSILLLLAIEFVLGLSCLAEVNLENFYPNPINLGVLSPFF